MRKTIIFMALTFLLIGVIVPQNKTNVTAEEPIEVERSKKIEIEEKRGYVLINNVDYETVNGEVTGELNKKKWKLYEQVDGYLYVNGAFHNVDGYWEDKNFWLNTLEFEQLFQLTKKNEGVFETTEISNQNVCNNFMTQVEILKILDRPNLPIENATITEVPSQLPGAERSYRNGFHEGYDWYSGAIGTDIDKNTKAFPIYDGEVVRIDHNYIELEQQKRDQMLEDAGELERTPQNTLDLLRGRQVWIQTNDNILVRYAHLSSVNSNLEVGDQVTERDWIGTTGNSGTNSAAIGSEEDIHLHTDILVCGKNFWEYGDREELVQNLIDVFKEELE